MDNILITGSNGFVGKSLVKKLEGKNFFCPSSKELNLLDYSSTKEYIGNNKINTVIHLAAIHGGVEMSQNQALRLLEDNTIVNVNVVKASIENNVEKFITFGSSCSYGLNSPLPIKEEYLWKEKPENTYGIAKLVMLEQLKAQQNMKWVYFIPTNIYGAGDHFGAKNMHIIPANILKFEDALKNGKDFIEVWGDGSQIRDFVYVDDIVSLIVESMNSTKYDNDIFNVSTNNGVTIRQIIEIIQKELGADSVEIKWDATKPTGILKKVCDNSKIKKISPELKFTSIEDGLFMTIKEHNNN